ncbi:hypothetical protein AAG565_04980 [Fontimonas sp. SYSU GA230001]|uniref:hypothetical protein n=1 Tax=Fontimonas sp. SYSU GA230001 TaxID=3142450 RepID=UPI0032B5F033
MIRPRYVADEMDGRLLIRFRGGLALRLFGLPWLIAGGWFLMQLLLGIVDSVRHHEMLLTLPGIALLIAMALVFGVPGWLMLLTRKWTSIDVRKREVLDVKDFVIWRRTRRLHALQLERVVASRETAAESRRTSPVFPVELHEAGGVAVLAAEFERAADAVTLGTRIASLLALPFVDETGKPESSD